MSILPLAGPGEVVGAAALAGSAASAVQGAFASLFAAFSRAGGGASAGSPATTNDTSAAETPDNSGPKPAGSLKAAEEKLRSRLESLLAGLHSGITRVLEERGVNLAAGVTLEADPLGTLRVVGDHPQKGVIETALAGHPELTELFRQIEAKASLLEAVRTANLSAAPVAGPVRVHVDGSRAVCLTSDPEAVRQAGV